jgi:ABC-type antimicrobial peptide transport system permease subunit
MIGIAAGLAVALAFARVMRSLVFGLSVMDPAVYAATAVTLAVVSVVATWTPARRASRVDPIVVLRNE